MNGVDDIAMAVRDQLCIDCVCTFRDGCGCTDAIAAAIEAAILAERERCAKVAENELRNTAMLMSNPPKSSAAWDIRNAILSGDPA